MSATVAWAKRGSCRSVDVMRAANSEWPPRSLKKSSSRRIGWPGTVNFETYAKLMRAYVGMTADGKLRRDGVSAQAALKPHTPGLPENAPPPGTLDVTLVGKRDSKTLAIGEAIVVKVVPPSTGYLYCYYQDAGAVVSQIYPNPAQPAAVAQGGRR